MRVISVIKYPHDPRKYYKSTLPVTMLFTGKYGKLLQYTQMIQTQAERMIAEIQKESLPLDDARSFFDFLAATKDAYRVFTWYIFEMVHKLFLKVHP